MVEIDNLSENERSMVDLYELYNSTPLENFKYNSSLFQSLNKLSNLKYLTI